MVCETITRIRLGLMAAFATHGLRRTEVLAVERAVLHLVKQGMGPSRDQFWRATAVPRSERLGREARLVIDGALDQLLLDAAPLRMTIATVDTTTPGAPALLIPGPETALIRRQLEAALPLDDDLQVLGRWWLRRLRRAAHRHALTHRREPVDLELLLLDRPPWCHSDRLLAAFELTHAEIRRYGLLRITETTDLLVDPRRSWLGALLT